MFDEPQDVRTTLALRLLLLPLTRIKLQAPGVAAAGGAAQRTCRLCKRSDHTANKCVLRVYLEAAAGAEPRVADEDTSCWAATRDEAMRRVLLAGACPSRGLSSLVVCADSWRAVQQLASAQLASMGKKRAKQVRKRLTPSHLRAVEAALQDHLARGRQNEGAAA